MEKLTQTPLEIKETHDFMNVESFSQLPFIRPAPHAAAVKDSNKPIKLFGIEFGNSTEDETTPTNNAASDELAAKEKELSGAADTTNNGGGESNRRFECHYCCRNFPTSQALGGHQNAHKRERQHAKRAHLQSAMVHGSLADYGFYRPAPTTYPSWTTTAGTGGSYNGSRLYGSYGSGGGSVTTHHHHQQPINGSPLAMWRIQNAYPRNDNSTSSSVQPLTLFAGDSTMRPGSSSVVVGRGNGSSSSHGRYVYEGKPTTTSTMQDHVSLDLHL